MPDVRVLYPPLEPFSTDFLPLDQGHQVYFEQSGARHGLPVLFLHGGPGSGCDQNHRRYFDPQRYRIILFDQRGCHRSVPRGSIRHNSTQDLLMDIERIRCHLGIKKWILFGGSWGATLALLYAKQYPQHLSAMILRGSFLARQADLDWFIGAAGVRRIFPDAWERFIDHFSATERADLIAALYQRLLSGDKVDRLAIARAWAHWSGRVVTASLNLDAYQLEEKSAEALLDQAYIEAHYAYHRYFVTEGQVLDGIDRLSGLPIHILHGRNDLTCLPDASWQLHQRLPGSELSLLPGCGHLASEQVMVDALIRATDVLASR